MIIPILGMHRSGTSFVARILHGAGVYLGEDLMKADSANLFGHWESWEAVKINDDILQDSGGSWHLPPKEIREAPETAERIRRFLSHFRSKPLASWKDPRTTFTFPLWRRHLKEYFVVAVFRNPVDVAKSLELREGWGFEKGLELWTKYNNRLIENLRDEKNIFWFDYDMPADQIPGTIRVLCEKIGLSFNNDLLKLFNSRLRNYRTSELPQDPGICLLYEELKKAKDYIIGNMMLGLETSDSQAEFCGYQEVLKKELKSPEELAKKIQAVTSEDIKSLANTIFTNQNLNMAIVGRFKTDAGLKKVFKVE